MNIDFNAIIAKLILFAPKLVAAILIFVIGWIIARLLKKMVGEITHKAKMNPTLGSFFTNLTFFTIMIFVFIAAIGKIGVQTTSFVALVGAAGLAIGLALQGSLSNFAAGVLILLFRPFNVNDTIQIGAISGKVHEIQIFTTILLSPDNKKIIIPNSKITSDVIINVTAMPIRRVDLVFSIPKTADIQKAKDIIKSVLDLESNILKDPVAEIVVAELGVDTVNLAVRPYVNTPDYSKVVYSVTEKVKLAFDTQLTV
jgi:small conductance mechanosensitive channel